MSGHVDEPGLRILALNVRDAIARSNPDPNEPFNDRQRRQLQTLVELEKLFREALVRHSEGARAYKAFMRKICDRGQNGNILTARPYFRERQEICNGPISDALEARHEKGLYPWAVNYNFVAFILKAYDWAPKSRVRIIAKKIELARKELIETNMPLAISQARIFWSKSPVKAPSTHLTYLDFVQIAADGLTSAVDKFVLPKREDFATDAEWKSMFGKFRPMAVQRMVGNFIEEYSRTLVHFFPKDKRKLYRANKLLHKFHGNLDLVKLAQDVNQDAKGRTVPKSHQTTPEDLVGLLAAATGVASIDDTGTDNEGNLLDRYADNAEKQPDVEYERTEAYTAMHTAMARLSVFDRKLLKLKGV